MEDGAWTWFPGGHSVINSGMSCFTIFSAFSQLHESPAVVPLMIHPFHQELYFGPAVPLEFLASGSNSFSEL
jgi:hypothetical protein